MRILILCTGNSCRSQMAHGFLQSLDNKIEVRSAGTNPAKSVSKRAIFVMSESGIDISTHTPENVSKYIDDEWDYVVTVCDNARETCPLFHGKVKHRLHMGFEDPAAFKGTEEQIMNEFRKIRDKINNALNEFYRSLSL